MKDTTPCLKSLPLSSFEVLPKEEAFSKCAEISMQVSESTGLSLWIFLGYRGTLLNPASGVPRGYPIWLGHVVCRIGDHVIDFTAKQFGDAYPTGPIIPISELEEHWAHFCPWTPGWVPSNKWLRNHVGLWPSYQITDTKEDLCPNS